MTASISLRIENGFLAIKRQKPSAVSQRFIMIPCFWQKVNIFFLKISKNIDFGRSDVPDKLFRNVFPAKSLTRLGKNGIFKL